MLTIEDLMTPRPYTLSPDQSIEDARKLMVDKHIRHIPILDADQNLVGLVTQRDLLKVTGHQPDEETDRGLVRSLRLADIMTEKVSTVDPSASLVGAALHLQKHQHGCLPIMRENRLIGIITDSDYIDIAINLLEQMEQTEPEEDLN